MKQEIKIDSLSIKSINSIKEISKSEWDNLVETESPLFDYDFLKSMEESGCTSKQLGWEPNHIIFAENRKILCIIPNYKKLNSNGEYVFDHNWAQAYYQTGLEYYPKLLTAIPFTPINGKRLFFDEKYNFNKYVSFLKKFIQEQKFSSFHFNFIEKCQSDNLTTFGFFQRLGIQYHWKNKNYRFPHEVLQHYQL